MVPALSLWLPVLVAAIVVFVASSVIHMLSSWHRKDFRQLPEERAVMEALRKFKIPPGDFIMPYCESPKAMEDPEFKALLENGPLGLVTVMPGKDFGMGRSLVLWFLYCLLIGFFAAYIAGRALGPGTHYLEVFRMVGATAFGGYSLALLQNSIWSKRAWATTFRTMVDGFVYALLTAGVFGWLWPAS